MWTKHDDMKAERGPWVVVLIRSHHLITSFLLKQYAILSRGGRIVCSYCWLNSHVYFCFYFGYREILLKLDERAAYTLITFSYTCPSFLVCYTFSFRVVVLESLEKYLTRKYQTFSLLLQRGIRKRVEYKDNWVRRINERTLQYRQIENVGASVMLFSKDKSKRKLSFLLCRWENWWMLILVNQAAPPEMLLYSCSSFILKISPCCPYSISWLTKLWFFLSFHRF